MLNLKQSEVLNDEGKILQEIRWWNADKQEIYLQRKKEEARDYRYFLEPNLPPFNLSKEAGTFDAERIKESMAHIFDKY